jgi:hypothetical protein
MRSASVVRQDVDVAKTINPDSSMSWLRKTVFSRIAWQAIEIERFLENEAVILAHQAGLEAFRSHDG